MPWAGFSTMPFMAKRRPSPRPSGIDDAVFVGLGLGHGLDADDVAADLGIELGQLLQGPGLANR